MARERARREPHRLILPLLEDMNAVQVARMQVLDALAAGLLEEHRAGLLLYGLQQASTDLRSLTAAPSLGVYEESDTALRAQEYPGFEAEFDLPQGIDLTLPPEVAFPAAAATATAVQARPSEYRSNPWQRVNSEDIQLEEVGRPRASKPMRSVPANWKASSGSRSSGRSTKWKTRGTSWKRPDAMGGSGAMLS